MRGAHFRSIPAPSPCHGRARPDANTESEPRVCRGGGESPRLCHCNTERGRRKDKKNQNKNQKGERPSPFSLSIPHFSQISHRFFLRPPHLQTQSLQGLHRPWHQNHGDTHFALCQASTHTHTPCLLKPPGMGAARAPPRPCCLPIPAVLPHEPSVPSSMLSSTGPPPVCSLHITRRFNINVLRIKYPSYFFFFKLPS